MKRNIYILYLIVLAVIILSTLLWAKFNKIGQIETKQPYYNITNKNDSIFDIYFIGDSWANRSNKYCFNQTLDSLLKSKKIASQTCSYGFDGYTSNEIYKKLFIGGRDGFKDIIGKRPKAIILSCGVNDQHKQLGPRFYAHHCSLIIDFLSHYNIRVILIELPNWDLKTNFSFYGRKQKAINRLANFFTTGHFSYDNNTKLYRKELYRELEKLKLFQKVIIIKAANFDDTNMWENSMHLNQKGYNKLAQIIFKSSLVCP